VAAVTLSEFVWFIAGNLSGMVILIIFLAIMWRIR
jgi:hypothetical protein